jgi:hypothetical protein
MKVQRRGKQAGAGSGSAVAFAVLGFLCAAIVFTAPATASAAGSISGTVTDAATHQPIVGVRVCAFEEGPEEEVEEVCAHSEEPSGHYSIAPLPAGKYAVEFLAGVEGLNYVYQAWHDQLDSFHAEPVPVSGGEVSGIDAELGEGGGVSGTLTGTPLGQPLAGVEVCAEPESFPGTEVCSHSGADGGYEIVGLQTDSYRLAFRPSEGVEFIEQFYAGEANGWEADPVAVSVGNVTPNINAALQEAGQITGTATDALTHAPIANLTVYAFDAFGNEYIHFPAGVTDAAGHYTIPLLAPGAYKVTFWPEEQLPGEYAKQWYRCNKETAVTVAAGHATPGIDAAMTKQGAFPVSCEPSQAAPPPPTVVVNRSCRKGFKRRRVNGKLRCVKQKARKHRRHRKGVAHHAPGRLGDR